MSRTPLSFSRRDFFDSFKEKHPDIDISPETYYKILNTGGQVMADAIIDDGEIKFANRIGVLTIRKFRPKGKGSSFMSAELMPAIYNSGESRKQKKMIFQFNDHTGGFVYRFLWSKLTCKMIIDKHMWKFIPIRSIKRRLAAGLKAGVLDYPIVDKLGDYLKFKEAKQLVQRIDETKL